jgi:uncharacterized membrane-anchored protein
MYRKTDKVKIVLAALMILGGILIGCYVGGYLMLYSGIVQIISGFKAGFIASDIAIGIIKCIFAGITGGLSAIIFIFPAMRILND